MSETVVIRLAEVIIVGIQIIVLGALFGAFIGWITRKGNAKGQEHE